MTETAEQDHGLHDAAMRAVGALLREAREKAGLTQQQLADALDVTQTAVSYWEAGKRDMGAFDLIQAAGAVGIPAASLLPAEPWIAASGPELEPPLPGGIWGRVELPGYRENTGWLAEETRFGQQMAVVRDWDGCVTAMAAIGPGCRVVVLPTPVRRPGPPAALPAGRGEERDPDEDLDDEDTF